VTLPREAWPRLKEVFEGARALALDARPAYLAAACGRDEALRREVETLLASHDGATSFLETPAAVFDDTIVTNNLEGQRIGPYQLTSKIGAGGMGEVYRARDTTLNRDVAIKILLPAVANDPDRLARFSREAQLLASLNHPHIAQIHGLENSGRRHALVMELVEGPTLADRIARGAIPLDEALPLAKQIAEALEAAHERGIIHRDLKPANIKIREDGTVKVLDFGLAKALDPTSGTGVDAMSSPAPGAPATAAHVIVGTAAYMSPEQARGRPADKRADIWAFGVVVFEMLAGQRLFTGETISDTLASVLRTDPNWRALPAALPPSFRRLLRWCLEKNPKRRLQAIGDARVQIEDLLAGVPDEPVATRPTVPRRRMIGAAGAIFTAGAAVAALSTWALTRTAPAKLQPVRFAIVLPAAQPLTSDGGARDLAMSPDGTSLVYTSSVSGESRLMVRTIDQLDAVPLGGITGVNGPFFSPDGRWIGFFSGTIGGELKKVSITGGAPVTVARTSGNSVGASWGPDDTIVFATQPSARDVGLLRVPAAGGEPAVLTTPDTAHGEVNHLFPSVLPGGRAVLFTVTSHGPVENAQVAALDLTTGLRKTLIRGGSQAEYIDPSYGAGPGYLLYAVAGTLRAVRFDPVKLEVLSDPVAVLDSVKTLWSGAAEFSVSRQGTLVYVPGGRLGAPVRSLVWVDRQGHEEPISAPPRAYNMPRLSPDGTRVAVSIGDQDDDLWIWNLARHTLTRLTDAPGRDWYPIWTPDGRRIVFSSARARDGTLFWQAADNTGTAEQLTRSPFGQGPASISSDGTRLIVMENMPKTGWDLRVLRLDGLSRPSGVTTSPPAAVGSRATERLVQTTATESLGDLSPDGRWLAYQSDESGRNQIWVRPFPNVDDGHWQISVNGGMSPVWGRNGRELFHLDGTNAVTSVPIRTAPTFSAGTPTKLFDGRYLASPFWRAYDVSPDGQRFLMIKDSAAAEQPSTPPSLVVVLNWFEELKRRLTSSGR
jgi:Tol biopolymer transport system component